MSKSKTPEYIKLLAARHRQSLDWIDDMLRVKATVPVENQANHVKDKPPAYFEGLADGYNSMMELALITADCYNGFMTVGLPHIVNGEVQRSPAKAGDVEYAGWRRRYFIGG